ncbi:pyruvate dehydrogenase complex dihydrolipoamide acetyltransferase [Haloferula sp. A504]|uniref:pyruvate dehydrogenase complex dihydrolipoamide acetyltransferase n=1 Tax=Haloferula sp. A504 TaxID=3373601 RepID=UPI0031C418FF|nr:pyruvate dehydrogenase complex dihydrolipoamide acetyltransferase [Verrucomicrobiaceae bacterium E54]
MATNIEMPKLSDTMTEGTLIKWHKQVGDEIEIGDVIAEVETDKATMEMEAFDEGTITSIEVQEGEKAPIGAVLAVLDGDGSGPAAGSGDAAESADAGEDAKPAETPAAETSSAPAEKAQSKPAPTRAEGERIKSSPLARKVAAELGVDLANVNGSGPAGRIVRADVEAAANGAGSTGKPSGQAAAAAGLAAAAKSKATAPAPQAIQPVVSEQDETIELTSMRRIIADRLLLSKQTIPHFYLHAEVDAAPLMKLRKEINAQAEQTHGNKYSVNDFILKAAINAAQTVPAVNASFTGDAIVRFASVGMSVAIAVEDGLVTPVIKNAETKSLLQISKEVKDLAVRARDKKLKPNEFDGGTITVSNLGAWGVESFDAIVNPPQAMIISVGGAIEKPVVKDGQVVPGLRMNLGISCDHRVVDGAVAAEYLAAVKKLIEQPALMLI